MLSILVGHSYFLRFDPKQLARSKPYPPLATLQVAARLLRAGHRVSLFDAMLATGVGEFGRSLRTQRPQLLLLYEDNYNFLSKMCLGRMRQAACTMIAQARRSGVRVIASGADASDAPEHYLRSGAEFVLLGEGLRTLDGLIARLDAQPAVPALELAAGLDSIAVLGPTGVERRQGRAASEPPPVARAAQSSVAIPQVDAPAWELVDLERYRRVWQRAHGYFSLNMAASRGCSFRCTWCAKPIWGNQYLQRRPASVAGEMMQLKRDFGVDHVWFADDIFGFRADWVEAFSRELAANQCLMPFTIQTRADLISERMAGALRAAGCREAWLGAESGSQRVLDAMNKGTTVADIKLARARLGAAGIRVGFFLQLGYLGEELEDLLATRDLLETALPDDVGVSVSYPLPGTRFYELVKSQLGPQTHWQQSDDLAMMFHGTYQTAFYRAIRDLLHERVSLESLNTPQSMPRYHRGRARLEGRWQDLIGSEELFRRIPSRQAQAG